MSEKDIEKERRKRKWRERVEWLEALLGPLLSRRRDART
jgi:hypothetical protein